jgi:hypothetical protein
MRFERNINKILFFFKMNFNNETTSPLAFAGGFLTLFLAFIISKKLIFGSKNNLKETPKTKKRVPISVNYHFSRKCNYECGFCFHTAKNSNILELDQAKIGLAKLKEAGMRKINFAGEYKNTMSEAVNN